MYTQPVSTKLELYKLNLLKTIILKTKPVNVNRLASNYSQANNTG